MDYLMLDLGAGLGGASQAMKERGWDVVTVDINPAFEPDIVADLRSWQWNGRKPDLIWASPPCTEFSKFAMPCWYDLATLPDPDMSIVEACVRIIEQSRPRYWIIENVRGAVDFFRPLLGSPAFVARPYYLWGFFPMPGDVKRHTFGTKTKRTSSTAKAARAKIPASLSLAIAVAIERQPALQLELTS